MGNGQKLGDQLNFQITANYDMQPIDYLRWERAFSKASELLYNATEGQLRFGRIYVTDENLGINNAEFVLDPDTDGRALGTFGRFGDIGEAIQLPAYAQRQVLSIIHELGHHLWALDEEYARAIGAAIDTGATLPAGHGNRIIPLVLSDLGIADAEFAGADALIVFGNNVETSEIVSKSGNRITVVDAFSQNPQNDSDARVTIQWTDDVECTGDKTTGACIMEFSRSNAGELEDDGTWTPAANPVTEFCTAFNHDADNDTGQENRYGESCWETIVDRPGFTDLASGAPSGGSAANKTTPGGYSPPQWIVLEPNPRFALVLDRSGSMNKNSGARLIGVKAGASYWVENAAVENDELTIIWYNTGIDVPVTLTNFGGLSNTQVETIVTNINAQSATGGTNIRDALFAALGQLLSPGTAAAVQSTLLLTDGAHNSPLFSSMLEVVPDFQDANTNIYTLGVGDGGEMDLPGLEELADETGGSALTVADGSDTVAIQNTMIEHNNLIRGGLVTSLGEIVPDMAESQDALQDLGLKEETPPQKRPLMTEILQELQFNSWQEMLQKKVLSPGRLVPFTLEIEEGAASATFTLSFENSGRLWMVLFDPDGNEVHAGSPEVAAFISSGQPYEFAKVVNPKAGRWTVLALRPEPGPAVFAKAIGGIQHRELTVHARAHGLGSELAVRITAGARFREPLSGLKVNAFVNGPGGVLHTFPLYDPQALGSYEVLQPLPPGHYIGYVEVRSPGNTPVGNFQHAVLHAENAAQIGSPIVKLPQFVRHVPISFYIRYPEHNPDPEEGREVYKWRRRHPRFRIKSAKLRTTYENST